MRENVLVLNQNYQPISICTAERAFVLVFLRKAEVLSDNSSLRLNSVDQTFSFPSIIRLYRYISVPYKRVNLSRYNIFKRDGGQCVYCGNKERLTLDHVVPRSLGGRDSWDNLVTACRACNAEKGNRTPEQAGMDMFHQPFRPSFVMFLSNFNGSVREDWKPYLYMS